MKIDIKSLWIDYLNKIILDLKSCYKNANVN